MPRKGIKVKDGELISESNVKKIIGLLNQENPISKKEACEILNIAYNTSRLTKIIEDYEDKMEFRKKRRESLRGKPISESEKNTMVSMFLEGEPLNAISETTYRSIPKVKRVLEEFNIPSRDAQVSYQNPAILPDESINDEIKIGDLVYSSRYGAPAEVTGLFSKRELGTDAKIFKIYLFGRLDCFAYQQEYELASLRKAQEDLGIKLHPSMDKDEINYSIIEALRKSKKKSKEEN